MTSLDQLSRNDGLIGRSAHGYTVDFVFQFRYEDPVDGSVAEKQVPSQPLSIHD